MTVFPRLKTMNDRQIQDWLRKVGRKNAMTLSIALSAADNEVRQCVYRNLSAKARAILEKDVVQNEQLHFGQIDIQKSAERLEKMF